MHQRCARVGTCSDPADVVGDDQSDSAKCCQQVRARGLNQWESVSVLVAQSMFAWSS